MPSRAILLLTALAAAAEGLVACRPSAAPPTAAQPPKIVFQETTYDFGHTERGTTVRHTYVFRNAGGRDLSIDNVQASCACTAAAAPVRPVGAGGIGRVTATLDTSNGFGPTTRTITVYSNDPAQPVTTLVLHGSIDAPVAAVPPQLYTGHLRRGERAPREVRLIVGAEATAIAAIDTTGTVLDASVRNARPGMTGRRIRVRIKADAPSGPFKETLVVRAKNRRQPVLTIPVTGIVDGNAPSSASEPAGP
ncbi:MAG: DUF1573 domain-containing protein [Candidatus Binatia bacterium]